jgi:hypothetical protein
VPTKQREQSCKHIFYANPDRFSVKIVDSAQNTRAKPRIPLTNL